MGFGRRKWRRRKAEEGFVDRGKRKVASVTALRAVDSGGGGGKPNQASERARGGMLSGARLFRSEPVLIRSHAHPGTGRVPCVRACRRRPTRPGLDFRATLLHRFVATHPVLSYRQQLAPVQLLPQAIGGRPSALTSWGAGRVRAATASAIGPADYVSSHFVYAWCFVRFLSSLVRHPASLRQCRSTGVPVLAATTREGVGGGHRRPSTQTRFLRGKVTATNHAISI
ncbi:hypothetical protein ZWY2020_012984 [Hordeum vulgare]|nr:hypothetical protein ZWY2020_012984 [Hordeum vulgare]